MPRGPRLDTPGTLHHVIIRGIEKREIVADDDDRGFFVARMGDVAMKTGTKIYAWVLMTNHAHILLKSGGDGLSTFMRKFLTGYSIRYNRRHGRHGHLFQNRYKSIVCEEEPYFVKLVAYIHLNPFRAGLVDALQVLDRYAWSGHLAMMGMQSYNWQDTDYALGYFGQREGSARKAYLEYLLQESLHGRQPKLTGGGLVRSAGGWSEIVSMKRRGERQFSDERILGSGEFAQEVVDDAVASTMVRVPLASRMTDVDELINLDCQNHGLDRQALESGCRRQEYSNMRKELSMKLVFDMGLSYADIAPLLGISASAVCQIVRAAAASRTM